MKSIRPFSLVPMFRNPFRTFFLLVACPDVILSAQGGDGESCGGNYKSSVQC